MRLVRSGLGKTNAHENPAFRDAARRLSPIRDAEATLETYDGLIDVFGDLVDQRRFRTIRTAFEHHREVLEEELFIDERLKEFRSFCEGRLEEIKQWELRKDGGETLIGGLQWTYGRGCKEFAEAREDRSAESFHEWRKRVKYHGYHMRIMRDV